MATKEQKAAWQKKYSDKREKTKDGVIARIYQNQKACSKRRGHTPPKYSQQELITWCMSNKKFHEIFDNWEQGGFKKLYKPSCDRLDNNKGYSFENIQLTTWRENKKRGHSDMKKGKITHGNKPQKRVIQKKLDGTIINEFHSISEAFRNTGVNTSHISKVCKKKLKTAKGFIWEYKHKA